MRDHEFRAKIKEGYNNSGEWEYFNLTSFIDSGLYGDSSDALTLNHINMNTLSESLFLFDKNGIRLYDMDIIRRTDEDTGVYLSVVLNHEFFSAQDSIRDTDVDGDDNLPCNEYARIFCCFYHDLESKLEDVEIIGNVYDNPEMVGFNIKKYFACLREKLKENNIPVFKKEGDE